MSDIDIKEIATGVYCARSPISNSGVVVLATVTVVVDTLARPSWARELYDFVALTAADRPVLTVNTHYHWDHVGGNSAANGLVVSTTDTRRTLLRVGEQYLRDGLGDEFSRGGLQTYLPHIALESAATIADADGVPTPLIEVCPEPAHTSGDLIVRVQGARITFLGDLLFNDLVPAIDANGSVYGWKRALDAELDRPGAQDEAFVGGHGPVGGADDVRALRDYLGTLVALSEDGAREGRPTEDVAADRAFEPYAGWGRQERHPPIVSKALAEAADVLATGGRAARGDAS